MKMGMTVGKRDASGKTALDVATQRAKGNANDPLVAYMTRTARVQALQLEGRRRRKAESANGGRA